VAFDDDFTVRPDDVLFVCGSIRSLGRYQSAFHSTATPTRRA